MRRIEKYLFCLSCKGNLRFKEDSFVCASCQNIYPIIKGVPRFVPESFYKLSEKNSNIEEKTKNYFGYQWDIFKDWGFIPDEEIPKGEEMEFYGGTVSARRKAFDSKCRMTDKDLNDSDIILDVGCGNGRYTYEAATRGKALVIGVDIGYGSVKSAYENTKNKSNVLIMQASLFNLPFKSGVIDSCFSNGVLMHTGDAYKAFSEVARTIKYGGVLVAHLYHKLNPVWEFNDKLIRIFTTKLSIENNLKLAEILARVAKSIDKIPNCLKWANLFLRLQQTKIHMYDWYSAPVASHHTYDELARWFTENGFIVMDNIPKFDSILFRPWGFNLKGMKAPKEY